MSFRCISCPRGTFSKVKYVDCLPIGSIVGVEEGVEILHASVLGCSHCEEYILDGQMLCSAEREVAKRRILHKKTLRPSEIKMLRKFLQCTREDVAKKLSIEASTVLAWEKGERDMLGGEEYALRLLVALDLSKAYPDVVRQFEEAYAYPSPPSPPLTFPYQIEAGSILSALN